MKVIPVRDYWGELLKSRESVYLGLIHRIPPRLWRPLQHVQNILKAVDQRQLYPHPSTFHVTVKGLGYQDRELEVARHELLMEKLRNIISEFRPFQLNVRGLGVFPTCIYAKIEDPMDQFRLLNKRISEELKGEVEQSEYDGDAYIPHVTLATFNDSDVDKLLRKISEPELRDFDFGICGVYEIEAVEANFLLALGPYETQDRAFTYVRSFQLG